MASPELSVEVGKISVPATDSGEIERRGGESKKAKKKRRKSGFDYTVVSRFGCFGVRSEPDGNGGFDMEVADDRGNPSRTHLIVMVNGLIGSAQDWKFAAKQFLKKYPDKIVVHCSECNSSTSTFDGVDVMGDRLAEEIKSVIKRHQGVKKISLVAHSLGGLIARYAIARLYEPSIISEPSKENGDRTKEESSNGTIAGLEPFNFITSATPHLGTWGHKQVPVFCGLYSLERVASRTSWFLGRTGKHLFLTDNDDGKPPLLLRMASDCDNLPFISALRSFKRRVAYANVHSDHLVGWSTSSLRPRNELPKLKKESLKNYPHIINEEKAKIDSPQDQVQTEAKVHGSTKVDMEEAMIKGLTSLSWERIDVSFHGSIQRFLAHNTIQVKDYWRNSHGADVIQHMVDNFFL